MIVNDKKTLYKPYLVTTYDSTKNKRPADSLDNCKKGYYNYKRRGCGIKNKLRESLRQNNDSSNVKSEMLEHISGNSSTNYGFSKIRNLINILNEKPTAFLFLEKVVMIVHFHTRNLSSPVYSDPPSPVY